MKNILAGIKEFFRKQIIKLKRQPSNIPLVCLIVCFLIYTLDLTAISNTTAYIYGNNMGLMSFISVMCGTVVIVAYLNAYPKRKKMNIPMFVISILLVLIIIYSDYAYYLQIQVATTGDRAIEISEARKNLYVYEASAVVVRHMIACGVTLVLMLTMPLYAKLIRKIDTTIDIEI